LQSADTALFPVFQHGEVGLEEETTEKSPEPKKKDDLKNEGPIRGER
jgi:hypothetical protein